MKEDKGGGGGGGGRRRRIIRRRRRRRKGVPNEIRLKKVPITWSKVLPEKLTDP
jgi:hypothetical protein